MTGFTPAVLAAILESCAILGDVTSVQVFGPKEPHMDTVSHRDSPDSYVSTGHLPPSDRIAALVEEAHEHFKSNCEGRRSSDLSFSRNCPGRLVRHMCCCDRRKTLRSGRLGMRIPDHERVEAVRVRFGV